MHLFFENKKHKKELDISENKFKQNENSFLFVVIEIEVANILYYDHPYSSWDLFTFIKKEELNLNLICHVNHKNTCLKLIFLLENLFKSNTINCNENFIQIIRIYFINEFKEEKPIYIFYFHNQKTDILATIEEMKKIIYLDETYILEFIELKICKTTNNTSLF